MASIFTLKYIKYLNTGLCDRPILRVSKIGILSRFYAILLIKNAYKFLIFKDISIFFWYPNLGKYGTFIIMETQIGQFVWTKIWWTDYIV